MSRHRSPVGRHAQPSDLVAPGAARSRHAPPAPPAPGAPAWPAPPPVPARPAAPPVTGPPPAPGRPARAAVHAAPRASAAALRNGLAAAAATGGTLALAVPMHALATPAPAPADAAVLRLAADTVPARPAVAPVVRPVDVAGVPADAVIRTAVLPVGPTVEPLPPEVGVAELIKAAGLADAARRVAAEERAVREARAALDSCDFSGRGLGRVKPWVRTAAVFLSCLYGEPALIGVARRAGASDHPGGLAVDFMVRGARGDALAACALRNRAALGISYVIWKQRVNYGDGWEPMADRGGDTANHYDHVHISFERRPPVGLPVAGRC